MPLKSFLETLSFGFLLGGALSGTMIAAIWFENKFCDLGEQIKELNSRLEDCEEKNAENHELKK